MDWPAILSALRRRWELEIERPDWCGLALDHDGRRERVAIKAVASEPALIISAIVCSLRHIQEREALRYNRAAELWSLGLEGELYVLERALGTAALVEEALAAAVQATVGEAQRLRQLAMPGRAGRDVSRLAFWFQ
jgi:hypothetical protein